jgi:hypothetical protein
MFRLRHQLNSTYVRTLLILASMLISAGMTRAQGSIFTYQGKLSDGGTAANGTYDMQFNLYDALTSGNQQPQPEPVTITFTGANSVQVTNGVFTVQLDFGASAFPGHDRFLDIAVKHPADSSYTPLLPRQQLTSLPYAIRAFDTAKLQGIAVSNNVPSNDQVLTYSQSGGVWASAPVVNSLTAGAGISIDSATGKVAISVPNGSITNAQLQNASITINPGTGLSGGGVSSLGSGPITLSNDGVLSVGVGGPLSSSGGQNPIISIGSSTGAGSVVLATGATLSSPSVSTGLTLTGNAAITSPRVENAASDPAAASSANSGRIYYNTATKTLQFSDGTTWQVAGPSAMFSGRINGLANSGSEAGAANGLSTAVVFTPDVETLSPNRACTAMNFAVQVNAAPGNSRSRTFGLTINGNTSSLITCTITGPLQLSCNSGSATHMVPARATLSIFETAVGGGVSGTAAAFSWECK